MSRGGNIPCALNAANEAAVKAFLEDRIGFYDVAAVARACMDGVSFIGEPSLEEIFATTDEVDRRASEMTLKRDFRW